MKKKFYKILVGAILFLILIIGAFFIMQSPEETVSTSNSKLQAIDCLSEQRNVNECIEIYQPVCGQIFVDCIKEPCDLIKETFENSCKACANERVISYTEGECQEELIRR